MENVYHFTDTARLPYILDSGVLRPGRNRIGGFPDPDFLWATAQSVGDRTASGSNSYRTMRTRLVRFTLDRADFVPWREIIKSFPQWTETHVDRLETTAKGMSDPNDWLCRAEPLNLSKVIRVESRSYNSPWVEHKNLSSFAIDVDENPTVSSYLGVNINGTAYLSREFSAPNGAQGYDAITIPFEKLHDLNVHLSQ